MTGLVIGALVTMAAGGTISAVSAYQQGRQAEKDAKAQAQMQKMQAEAYGLQAADQQRQAGEADARAGIAQIQAEQEAERRSRIMAADIGSTYANFAGNGLLVDVGSKDDTFGNVLSTTVAEAQRDISTIRDNGRMSVWEQRSNARSLMTSAQTSRLSQQSSLLGAQASLRSGKAARRAGTVSAIGSLLGSLGSIGMASASYFGKPAASGAAAGGGKK